MKVQLDDSKELDIYKLLQQDPKSRRYVLPCEIVEDAERPFMVMPFVGDFLELDPHHWSLSTTLTCFDHILEVRSQCQGTVAMTLI